MLRRTLLQTFAAAAPALVVPRFAYGLSVEPAGSLQAAIDQASAVGTRELPGVVDLEPGRVYELSTGNGARNTSSPCVLLRSNVVLRTRPTGRDAPRATLRFQSWSGQRGMHNRSLLRAADCQNVLLENLICDGNRSSGDVFDVDYSHGRNGGLLGLEVARNVNGLLVRNCEFNDCMADGVLIADDNSSENVWFQNSVLMRNRRQGCSIVQAGKQGRQHGYVFDNCRFAESGDLVLSNGTMQPGHKPAAGVDLEGNQPEHAIYGVTFLRCLFDNQRGSAFVNGKLQRNTSAARGFVADHRGTIDGLTHIDSVCRDNGENFALVMRDRAAWKNVWIDGLTCTGARRNDRLNVSAAGGKKGTIAAQFQNLEVSEVRFHSSLKDRGHDVTVYLGGTATPVVTSGKETIRVEAGTSYTQPARPQLSGMDDTLSAPVAPPHAEVTAE